MPLPKLFSDHRRAFPCVLLDVGIPPRLMQRAHRKWYRQQHDTQQEADAHLEAVGLDHSEGSTSAVPCQASPRGSS